MGGGVVMLRAVFAVVVGVVVRAGFAMLVVVFARLGGVVMRAGFTMLVVVMFRRSICSVYGRV
jgi:hypothetical protein